MSTMIDPALQPMSAMPMEVPPISLTTSHRPAARTSFGRQLQAELRKLVDTRSGFWLVVAGLLLSALSIVGLGLLNGYVFKMAKEHPEEFPPASGDFSSISWLSTTTGASTVLLLFLALLSILLATSEWTTRSGLTTFALEPRRARVLGAKVVAAVGLALALGVLSLPLGAISATLASTISKAPVDWHMDWARFAAFLLVCVITTLFGMAWGLLTLSSVAGIIAYFAIPFLLGAASALSMLWSWVGKVTPWVDMGQSETALMSGTFTAERWGQFLVTHLLWVAIPFAIGAWRWMRREVK